MADSKQDKIDAKADAKQAKADATDNKAYPDNEPGVDALRAANEDYDKTSAGTLPPDKDVKKLSTLKGEEKDIGKRLREARAVREQAAQEEQALIAEAQAKNAEIMRMVGTPGLKPTDIVSFSRAAKAKGEKLVPIVVPKHFQLRLDDHSMIDVLPGVRQFPESLANHWWLTANGCTPADADAD